MYKYDNKTEYNVKLYSSAKSGRVERICIAPPFLIYLVFGLSVLLQIPAGYIIHEYSFTLGMLINQVGILLVPVLLAIRFLDLTGKAVLPFKKIKAREVLLAVLMMLSLAVISDYLIFVTEKILHVEVPLRVLYEKLMRVDGSFSFLHKLIFLCCIPSFCEEIFFRGFCQTGLERSYGKWIGISVVAVMFAAAHLSPYYLHIYLILGLFLGWLFSTSGNLWIPVFCHISNNLWTFLMQITGLTPPYKGIFGLWDIFFIIIALIILSGTVYLWRVRVSNRSLPLETVS